MLNVSSEHSFNHFDRFGVFCMMIECLVSQINSANQELVVIVKAKRKLLKLRIKKVLLVL